VFGVRANLRLPVALVAALVVAEAGVVLLRPREVGPAPAPVNARAYFSAAELERARDFRRPQLGLFALRLGVEAGVLVLLVRRPPRRLAALARRPVLGVAAAGAGLALVVGLAPLPLEAVARARAVDVGLVTQGWDGWAWDLLRSQAIGAAMAAAGAVALVALARRFPRRWWLPASGLVVAVGAGFTFVAPVVLDPVFNDFRALPAGHVRADVLELARRADVDVGEVYAIDASRRTSAANAYVAGLGRTKRVVLYDNLLDEFSRDELRLVVAHELGHVHHRDVPRGLLYVALIAPFGLFAAQRLSERLSPARGTAEALPALALSLALVSTGLTFVSNQLSRRVEARADFFALRLTGEPRAAVGFQRRIALRNVSDPDPPGWVSGLLGTHPTTLQRIGAAESFRPGEAPRPDAALRRTQAGS